MKILEGKGAETVYGRMWRWRGGGEGDGGEDGDGDGESGIDGRRNGLEEGEQGPRVLAKQKMAEVEDWKFT